ncbi:putative F420-dependent oxidoreductase, MSMEG_2516 family [Saccharomonospora glauca K62]|uniref:Putative F420-dependent oxidoreductase, MSMEG_2516 family n=1 Tax=Saccharomonospora glauca K62 TaxID=928724 RepID=I1D865_9PSEU|nr:putative F420-dependent oxidoreductase, MSMEG_2516 family [Saccharomonospora glauca K62]
MASRPFPVLYCARVADNEQAPFRFGVNLLGFTSHEELTAKVREAERLGYDVVCIPDHLGFPAPFPSLVAAARATSRVRLGTFVLNTAFYNPVLLARDVASTDRLVDGRLDLGLGTGYVESEFDRAGIPFPTPGKRIDHLKHTIAELRRAFDELEPAPAQRPTPPLLLGGHGDRMLRLAAREADIVGFTGHSYTPSGLVVANAEEMDERVAFVRKEAGDRADELEFNLLVQRVVVTDDRAAALEKLSREFFDIPADTLGQVPYLLVGTLDEIAEQVRAHRARYGITYFTVLDNAMTDFAAVFDRLR